MVADPSEYEQRQEEESRHWGEASYLIEQERRVLPSATEEELALAVRIGRHTLSPAAALAYRRMNLDVDVCGWPVATARIGASGESDHPTTVHVRPLLVLRRMCSGPVFSEIAYTVVGRAGSTATVSSTSAGAGLEAGQLCVQVPPSSALL